MSEEIQTIFRPGVKNDGRCSECRRPFAGLKILEPSSATPICERCARVKAGLPPEHDPSCPKCAEAMKGKPLTTEWAKEHYA